MLLIREPALRSAGQVGQVGQASRLPLKSESAELQVTRSFSPGEEGFLLQLRSPQVPALQLWGEAAG